MDLVLDFESYYFDEAKTLKKDIRGSLIESMTPFKTQLWSWDDVPFAAVSLPLHSGGSPNRPMIEEP